MSGLVVFALVGMGAEAEKPHVKWHADMSAMSTNYWKHWLPEPTRQMDAVIEQHRKADFAAKVGAPAGAEVEVVQIENAFFFGAQIFNFNQLGKAEWNAKYRELWGTLFNSGTVAFYWRGHEKYPGMPRFEERYEDTENFWNNCLHPIEQDHWRRPATDPVIDHLKARGCRIHAHPLVWGDSCDAMPYWLWDQFCPKAEKDALAAASGVVVPSRDTSRGRGCNDSYHGRRWVSAWQQIFAKLSDEEIARLIPTYLKAMEAAYERRVRQVAERYGARLDSCDVVNESARDFSRFGKNVKRGKLFDRSWYGLMPADYALKAFLWAKQYLPASTMLNLNDYMLPESAAQLPKLREAGAKIDVIGCQRHLILGSSLSGKLCRGEVPANLTPAGLLADLAPAAKLNMPIHISEVSITAPNETRHGQMVQAILMRHIFRCWFSCPQVAGITLWSVVDRTDWVCQSPFCGIFTRDMQPKIAYYALDDLVNHEWRTSLKVKAQDDGTVAFRGFKGRYRLTWKDQKGKTQTTYVTVK